MENFRQFEAGPDPFGRTWKVEFKWMQTAISLRHSDTVDVKFVLRDEETRSEKTIALPHADLLRLSKKTGRPMTDAWCSRLAALHLQASHRNRRGHGEGPGDACRRTNWRRTTRSCKVRRSAG